MGEVGMVAKGKAASGATANGNGAGGRRGDSPLDRVLHALGHPMRRQILRSLVRVDGSASSISRELDLDLSVVSYHLNQVLAKECGVVELVEAVERRGALEKIYGLKFAALGGGDPFHRAEPEEGIRPLSVEECFIVAVTALDEAPFGKPPGSAWEWSLARVDAEGWREICAAREEFDRRTRAAVDASRRRGPEQDTREVVVGAANFPAENLRQVQ
ncbi:MAG TPA: winged helix-turn-helix domain-containing protein [Solirubrobacterales bacterium]|nr:winged helix-turn-helix domain-containing protein [Solirubrobacterales bacterium]